MSSQTINCNYRVKGIFRILSTKVKAHKGPLGAVPNLYNIIMQKEFLVPKIMFRFTEVTQEN